MIHGHDDIARLKAEVHCGTVLERLSPPWRLDRRESTKGALKYRRDRGEIIIVNHDGHGWWDPCDPEAKGDVLDLVQRLAPGAGFKEALQHLSELAGIFPAFPEHCPEPGRPRRPVTERWLARPPLTNGSATWRYLAGARGLPERILLCAAGRGLVREGPDGSAWFAHRTHDGSLTGIEMRGPKWRGFSAASEKSLFRLPGSMANPNRLAVTEAPIDALSLAALEGPRAGTLYLATAGGMGPGTVTALQVLLAGLAARGVDTAGGRHRRRPRRRSLRAVPGRARGGGRGRLPTAAPAARAQGLERCVARGRSPPRRDEPARWRDREHGRRTRTIPATGTSRRKPVRKDDHPCEAPALLRAGQPSRSRRSLVVRPGLMP